MSDLGPDRYLSPASRSGETLADLLDRVLDKGLVIAGDVQVNLLDIELLTLKIRLLVASADKAREMGIDWWDHDPHLSSRARQRHEERHSLQQENDQLRQRLEKLESNLQQLVEQQQAGAAAEAEVADGDETGDG